MSNTSKGAGKGKVNTDDFVDHPVIQNFDTSAFVDLPIGFDPYWLPEAGKKLVCRVSEVDARDPAFVRFRFVAVNPTACQRGDKNHREDAAVDPGGFFTMSIYGSIKHELIYQLQNSMQSGVDTPVIELECKGEGLVKKGEHAGKPFWNFGMRCSVQDKARLAPGREAYFKQLGAAPTRPAIDTTSAPAAS